MPFPEAEALEAEATALLGTLEGTPDDAWSRPALGRWDLAALVAHIARGQRRLVNARATDAVPAMDRHSYFRQPHDHDAIAARAAQDAAALSDAQRLDDLATAVQDALAATATSAPAQVVEGPAGPIRFDELTATRVLELVVHHMDAAACLEVPPVTTPVAGRMAAALCEGLLEGPRPRAMGRARFLRAATGRTEVDDPRFPVLS